MRKCVQVLASVGVFVATMTSLPGVASAARGAEQVECTYATDGSTFASVVCKTNLRYRVLATYCRLNCTVETGPWKYDPFRSEVAFPSGGTIVNYWSEIG
jgi:hypothetical protein